jgi:acetyl esterase/lipase
VPPSTPAPPPAFDPECSPALRALLDGVQGGSSFRIDAGSLAEARTLRVTPQMLMEGRDVRHRDERVAGPDGEVVVAVFTPSGVGPGAPGLCWIHGGGMVMGDRFACPEALDLAEAVGMVVASVEYRLAPEHPAPAPLHDCLAALGWLHRSAGRLGIDPHRLVLGGTSAGGGLAAAAALAVRDRGGPRLAGLLLGSPMLDDRMTTVSSGQFGDDVLWSASSNRFGWRSLLGERAGTEDVSVYEAPGRMVDGGGLPPTLVDVGSADLFRDEDVAFAAAIWAAGGDADLHVWSGGYHGFDALAPGAALSRDLTEVRRRWLTRVLRRSG